MKELEKEFIGTGEVEGFTFKQIAHSPYAECYEITNETGKRHYETFERKERQKSNTVIAGKDIYYEAKVLYPKSNDFGIWAWCIRDYNKALKKFNAISRK